ncbi:MAG: hypothetical protein IKA05_09430 [Clostridia bacterium]|nr:hypothetical protein [Clostridia bacterium]
MKKTALNRCGKIGFVFCTVLAAIFQFLAACNALDITSNYFHNDSPFPFLATVFAILGVICGSIAALTAKDHGRSHSPFDSKPILNVLACIAASVAFLATALLFLSQSNAPLTKLLTVFAALATMYEILCLFPRLRIEHSGLVTLVGFSTVLLCVVCNAYYYFDVTVEMNAPFKVSLQMGLLAAMVYFTGELRYLLNKPLPRMYRMLAAWTMALGALSVPALFLAFFTQKNDRIDYLAGAILMLGICLSVCLRVFSLHIRSSSESNTEDVSLTETDTIGKDTV